VHAVEQAVVAVVDQLVLLLLLDPLDRDRQLLLDLVHRAAEQVRDPGVDLHGGRDRGQHQLAWLLLVIDLGDRQLGRVVGRALDGKLVVDHAVDAVDAGLDRGPRQQLHQPARRAADPLRRDLGGVGELPRGALAERVGRFGGIGHGDGILYHAAGTALSARATSRSRDRSLPRRQRRRVRTIGGRLAGQPRTATANLR
jgi:hypothetical protein